MILNCMLRDKDDSKLLLKKKKLMTKQIFSQLTI